MLCVTDYCLCIADPEKEYTCPKGTLVVNGAQICSQSLAATVYRGLSHTQHFRRRLRLSCQASCTAFLLSNLNLIKEFLESYFHQLAEICRIQLELLICTFTNESE